jgi:2-polyprenyl-3-methyl-5-hydroxy-6-metoxy-1,4-benzoquinol methylase
MVPSRNVPMETSCPYCRGAARLHVTGRDVNRRVSNETFHLYRCERCGLRFILDPPSDLRRYYPRDYHVTPASAAALDPHLPAQRFKIDLVTRFATTGSLLEIGASNGVFCRLAQQAGFDVSAIEMDEDCVGFLHGKLGVRVVASPDPAAALAGEASSFDAICLWHTIEHLPRPWDVLGEAVRHLKPNGVLVIAAPNPDAWQARVLGARWPHHDMPRHLFALPMPWIAAFAKSQGLSVAMMTTRDEGSLFWNRFTWAMVLRSMAGYRDPGGALWRLGMMVGGLLAPWEGREGRGATYTAVLRRPG